jgi:hypothetical protein
MYLFKLNHESKAGPYKPLTLVNLYLLRPFLFKSALPLPPALPKNWARQSGRHISTIRNHLPFCFLNRVRLNRFPAPFLCDEGKSDLWLLPAAVLLPSNRPGQSTHRVAIADFWRTFHHDGKISPSWWGWGCTPIPFHSITITYKVAASVRSSWEGRYNPCISTLPICIHGPGYSEGGGGRQLPSLYVGLWPPTSPSFLSGYAPHCTNPSRHPPAFLFHPLFSAPEQFSTPHPLAF